MKIKLLNMKRGMMIVASAILVLMCSTTNAWAGGSFNTWLRVSTDDTAKGLVYASKTKDQTPDDNKYGELVLSESVSGSKNKQNSFYGWAKPARGYTFNTWTAYTYAGSDKKKGEGDAKFPSPKQVTGVGDLIYSYSWNGNAGDDQANSAKASWNAATSYNVVYKEPVGGSYTVDYSYVTINSSKKFATSTEKLELAPGSGDKQPYGISDGSQEGYSYAADVVTLTSSAANFEGWYEDGVQKSTASSYTYPITKTANVTAVFKNAIVATPEEVSISTNSTSTPKDTSVVFDVEATGTWAADASGFTAELSGKTGPGTFSIISKSYSAGKLTVNVRFTANEFDAGTRVQLDVAPTYGTGATAVILGLAEETVDYQARVKVGGAIQRTGTLADMLDYANSLDTRPTLQLTQNVTATSTLQFRKSMVLDLNNKKLSATSVDKLILVKGNSATDEINLIIADSSYTASGEMSLSRNTSGTKIGIEIADNNQVTYQKGKLSVSNTSASTQGIHVTGTGNLLMLNGKIDVTANSDARAIYAESGFATIMGGQLTATANTKAYALYTAAKSNVSDASLVATTATGAEATAVYVHDGTAVLDGVVFEAEAKTTKAYGAYVKSGKLAINGGYIVVRAESSDVYGVNIQAGAQASVQQHTTINVEATGTSGTKVYGIQNLGTLILANSSIAATSATYSTAVNSETSATSTTIEGGEYSANATSDHAYGLHHQYGTLNVDGGSFTATTGTDAALAVRAAADGTIANATMIAETTGSGKTARGFTGGVENINITLTNCTIKAKSATSTADAIYSRANVTVTGCELEAKTLSSTSATGFYAEKGTNVLKNTNATVESFTTNAYGINYLAGTLTVDGGTYSVTARHNKTLTAVDNCLAYGVYVADGKTANLSNASFSVSALNGSFSQNAYGAYTGTGTINSTGCTYNVSAATLSYGVFGSTSSTLNLQNNTISASTVGSTKARGIYSAGTFTVDGDDVTSDTKTYDSYPLYFSAAAHGEVLGGKFMAKGTSTKSSEIIAPINTDASAANVQVKGGFFSDNVRLRYYVPDGYDIFGVDPSAPEYAEKYYYTVNDHLPYDNVCYITEKSVGFPTLEEAFDYARNHSGSSYNIIMIQPYTLPAGNYSLPSNATLVVPDRASRTTAIGTTAQRQCGTQDLITENRCLTFANGVNLDVYGTIEVSAKQYTTNTGRIAYVLGPYGRIHLQEGSTITLNNGAKINAWGYITGQGEIRVKNGATVREFFQVHDMKAASAITDWTSSTNKNTYKAFVMNQYYIQSVEAPTKYYYGGQLIGSLSITSNATATSAVAADNVKLVGTSDAFFNVDTDDESAWVRKSYNPTTDRVLWETNSSASLGSIAISMSSYSIYSKDYVLPFTNNMTVHALTGKLNITQSTVLLPGCEVVVDKTATLHINEKDKNGDNMGLYLYDLAQWGKYYESSNKYFLPVVYSPSWTNGVCPRGSGTSNACLKDAALYVKGKIEVAGSIYTTADGAAIYSDNTNAGTIDFNKAAAADGTLYRTYNGGGATTVTSAKLRNGGLNGTTFTATKDNANVGDTYAYANIDGNGYKWTKLTFIDDCVIADETDSEHRVYYAKPQGYVAITDASEDANHLFHSVAGSRLFIQQYTEAGCQWWEVTTTATADIYYCATNETYYKYVGDEWKEYTVHVTFYFTDPKDEAANKKKVLTVNYGAKPDASIVSNPSMAETAQATYQFYGWKSSMTGSTYAYTAELETVTEDMYYLPVFTSITKKYTVTFKKAKNGADVPVEVFYGASPEYNATKSSTAQYSYEFTGWKAANNTIYAPGETLPPLTGTASEVSNVYYTAQWAEHVRSYDITWKNGDRVIEVDENQPYGSETSYDDLTPTRATTNSYEYIFIGWKSSINGNTYPNGETPTVAGETTYSAQFTETPRYLIKFVNYDGTELSSGYVTQGQVPVCNSIPRRERDATFYYVFDGWKNSNGDKFNADDLPTVSGKETYTAQFLAEDRMYTITFNNIDNNGGSVSDVFGHGAIPGMDVADLEDETYRYIFAGWTPDIVPVEADASYTAVFKQVAKKLEVGASEDETIEVPENMDYEVTQVHVYSSGHLTVPESSSITATDLIFEATSYQPGIDGAANAASGEIDGIENIHITGNAYFDLSLNTAERTWHAFGVPWEIDLNETDVLADGQPISLENEYAIAYYNGEKRAEQGPGPHCWEYVEFTGKKLTPGQGYMIGFVRPVNKVRFTAKDPQNLQFDRSVRTQLYNEETSNAGKDSHWNAIATPEMFHAALDAGVQYCQVHVPFEVGSDTYQTKEMAGLTFVSGMSVYVQAIANRAVVITATSAAAPSSAPILRPDFWEDDFSSEFEITIKHEGKTVISDNIFIKTEEEKSDVYTIGKDLAKAGYTTKVAQMWVNRYNTQLCVNTMAMEHGTASYPLKISIPQAGEYVLEATPNKGNNKYLYLTYDGKAIWNLSHAPFVYNLPKGTLERFGLRISNKAERTYLFDLEETEGGTQGLDEVVVDAHGETRKVLINNHIYIIREDNVYTIDGKIIK